MEQVGGDAGIPLPNKHIVVLYRRGMGVQCMVPRSQSSAI